MDTRITDNISIESFDGYFSKEQLDFITSYVTDQAKEKLGSRLKKVILYGSYARGDNQAWSDVDILLLVDADMEEAKRLQDVIRDALHPLSYHMNLLLSIIVTSIQQFEEQKSTVPFFKNVDSDGVRIYAQ